MSNIIAKQPIINGIYTYKNYIYIVLNEQDCLSLDTFKILQESENEDLCNVDVCMYISMHYDDFSVFDIDTIDMLEKKTFDNGYLGSLNEVALQDLEKFKKIWMTI